MVTYHRYRVRVEQIIMNPNIAGREVITTCVFRDVDPVIEGNIIIIMSVLRVS